MSLYNTTTGYGSVAKFFHWTVAVLILGMLCLGFLMDIPSSKALKGILYTIHKSTGVTILGLMILRVLWRWSNITPQLPLSVPFWQQKAAHLGHVLLYIAIFAMILSGLSLSTAAGKPVNFWWMVQISLPWIPQSESLVDTFATIHKTLAWVIIGLVSLHILAVIKHVFIDKRPEIFKRMAPGAKL